MEENFYFYTWWKVSWFDCSFINNKILIKILVNFGVGLMFLISFYNFFDKFSVNCDYIEILVFIYMEIKIKI